MLHLTTERLAALADEQPNTLEATHLGACPACHRELRAQRQLRELARMESTRHSAPLTTWEGIEAAMRNPERDDATADTGHSSHTAGSRRRAAVPLVRRLAAAAVLLASGVAAGRYSAGASPVPVIGVAAGTGQSGPTPVMTESTPAFTSAAEALEALSHAEREYQLATNFLAAREANGDPLADSLAADSAAIYRTRLAALDEVMAATRTALYEAPHDPVINRYYLATLGAREVTVRQLGTSLPPGQSVSRF